LLSIIFLDGSNRNKTVGPILSQALKCLSKIRLDGLKSTHELSGSFGNL
jgi:hypothetical protein